jgi:hypothetical protein
MMQKLEKKNVTLFQIGSDAVVLNNTRGKERSNHRCFLVADLQSCYIGKEAHKKANYISKQHPTIVQMI